MTTLLLTALLTISASVSTHLVHRVYVTAYTAHDHCSPDDPGYRWCDGRTASGAVADPAKRIAACPPEIRFGTKVYVAGLGVFTCLDRGSAIQGRRLDVLVETTEQARAVTGWRWVVRR